MSLKSRVVLLLGLLGLETLWYHSLSCLSPYTHPYVTSTYFKLRFISKYHVFTVIRWENLYVLSHLWCLAHFPLLRHGLQTAACPLRPLQDSLLLIGLYAGWSLALILLQILYLWWICLPISQGTKLDVLITTLCCGYQKRTQMQKTPKL